MKRTKSRLPVKLISISFLYLFVSGIVLFLFFRWLTTAEYFKVKSLEYFTAPDNIIRQETDYRLNEIIGMNIFKIDLKKQARILSNLYPHYKRIILQRKLPDRVSVIFQLRKAAALLVLPEDFYVDEDGVLFNVSGPQESVVQLPSIVGLRRSIPNPYSGMKHSDKSLKAILGFIKNVNKDAILSKYIEIREINLANTNDVFLFTTDGCKINLGDIAYLNKDLVILRRLFGRMNSELSRITYIDLRFKEPVVKYK